MKLLLLFLSTFTFLFSVSSSEKEIPKVNNYELNGRWRLDSSSNSYYGRRIMFFDDKNYYQFNRSNGGGLSDKGQIFSKDSIQGKYEHWKYHYKLIDSNHIRITQENGQTDFYEKADYGNYKKYLKEYLKADTLRNQILGWWKTNDEDNHIKLINYPGRFKNITMNIKNDGEAVFYKNNYLDSAVTYGYSMREDGIDFSYGCIAGSDTKVERINDSTLVIYLQRFSPLKLHRIYKI